MSCRYFFSTVDISTVDIATVDICNSTASQSCQTFSTLRCNFTRPVSENSESSGWDNQCKVTLSQLICTLDHFVTLPCFVLHLWHCDSLQRAWAWPGLTQPNLAQFELLPTVVSSVGNGQWAYSCVYCQAKSYNRTTHPLSNFELRCRGHFKRTLI